MRKRAEDLPVFSFLSCQLYVCRAKHAVAVEFYIHRISNVLIIDYLG